MNELNQTQNRKHYTPEQKVHILRRRLLDRISIRAVCEENQIHPTQFYQWQKQFFDNGVATGSSNKSRRWKINCDARTRWLPRLWRRWCG